MPWWAWLALVLALLIASFGESPASHAARLKAHRRQDPIDNIGSWLALALLIFLSIAYYWPN
jgi:hypothetical protein